MTTVMEGDMSELTLNEKILMQYEFVRRYGTCNMFDRLCVQAVAEVFGYGELAHVTCDSEAYAELLSSYKKPDPTTYAKWLETNGKVFDVDEWLEEFNEYFDEELDFWLELA